MWCSGMAADFKKEPTTRAEEAKNRTYQESDGLYHEKVLAHFACGRQRCILLKSQADRVLANNTRCAGLRSEGYPLCLAKTPSAPKVVQLTRLMDHEKRMSNGVSWDG